MKTYLRAAVMSALGALNACGAGDPTPLAADIGVDGAAEVDVADAAALADVTEPDDGAIVLDAADTTQAGYPLPSIDNWLLLTPNEGLSTIAVQPAVAWDTEGRLAVAWTGKVGEVSGIVGGLFEMARTPFAVTGPDMLTSIETGLRNEPRLCTLTRPDAAEQGFVAAWSADLQNGGPDNLGVYSRRFDKDLSPVTSTEDLLESGRAGNHWLATLACRPGGGYVVGGVRVGTGAGFEAFAQRFDEAGATVGAPLVGLERELGGQLFPAVATDGGDVWLVWEDSASADAESGIMARRFDASGVGAASQILDAIFPRPAAGVAVAAAGGSVLIAASGANGLAFAWSQKGEDFTAVSLAAAESGAGGAAIAPISAGRYAVVWTRSAGSNRDLRLAIFADGAFVGAPITLANGKFTAAYRPAIAVRDGRLAVAFTESMGGGAYNIRVAIAAL